MRVESARRQGDELCLTTKDPEAWRWLYNVVQDAKALGIETLSERELSLLKEGWQ